MPTSSTTPPDEPASTEESAGAPPSAADASLAPPHSGDAAPALSITKHEHPNLAAAMIAAYADIAPVRREREGQIGHRSYAYAGLSQIHDELRPVLASHGIGVFQPPLQRRVDGTLYVGCEIHIMHESGETLSYEFIMACPKENGQAMGSLVTYARRYSYPFAIAQDETDDDGAAAMPSNGNGSRGGGSRESGQGRGNRTGDRDPGYGPPPEANEGAGGDDKSSLLGEQQNFTLIGLAQRRAKEFDDITGAEILKSIATEKGFPGWDDLWPKLRVRQMSSVSKTIQTWEPPISGDPEPPPAEDEDQSAGQEDTDREFVDGD